MSEPPDFPNGILRTALVNVPRVGGTREPCAARGARSGMRNPRPRRLRAVLAATALAASLAAVPASAEEYKIGVLHVERILQQSAAAKAAYDRIEQEFKPRDADIAGKEQEIRDAAAQLDKARATLSADEQATRERGIETRTRDVQRLREQFAEQLRARQFEELDKLKERLDRVLTRYAKERNFDLILQSALYVGRAVDITDDVIKALAASP